MNIIISTNNLTLIFYCIVSVTGKRGVGIPLILLHDAVGGIVTIELKNGCIYRGVLEEAQDNMNCTINVNNSNYFLCNLFFFNMY
jgi:hypothetical protein